MHEVHPSHFGAGRNPSRACLSCIIENTKPPIWAETYNILGDFMERDIKAVLQFVWATLQHKYFVLMAGLRTKVPIWRLIIHDLSKFGPSELLPYARQFHGDKTGNDEAFARAWLHHQNVNPHHWEYWVTRSGNKLQSGAERVTPIDMPEHFVREMVADWMGASRSYSGYSPASISEWDWLQKNWPRISVNTTKATQARVYRVLGEVFNENSLKDIARIVK